MKTTLELPDDLLIEAKSLAAKRRTTLRAIVEHALRREISPVDAKQADAGGLYQVGPHGILSLKPRGRKITSEAIYRLLEEEDSGIR